MTTISNCMSLQDKICIQDNLEEIDKFLESYSLPRLNHEETEILNKPMANKESEGVILKIYPKEDIRIRCLY